MHASIAAGTPAAASSIPFQHGAGGFAGDVTSALAIAVGLLVVLLVILLLLRRAGWLRRWSGEAPDAAATRGLRILQKMRLSPATRLYVVGHEGREYVIVESSQRIVMRSDERSGKADDAT